MSEPGWIKEFNTEEELKKELFDHICSGCRSGCNEYVGGFTIEEPPVTIDSTIDEMLFTSCGCEYAVDL